MTTKPNVLFIFSDQHSPRITGCYGDPVAETPNIDKLAGNGVTFDNCYAPSPVCTPSRMSMLTARYPHRQRVWTNTDILDSNIPTFPNALAINGYQPVLAGRMHSLGADQHRGYAKRYVGDHSPNWPGKDRPNMGVLHKSNSPDPASVVQSGSGKSVYELLDHATGDAAVEALQTIKDKGGDDPFFLTVGFMLPHAPYVADAQDYARFEGKVTPARIGAPDPGTDHPFMREWREDRGLNDLNPDDELRARTAYYALTYRLDCLIGKVIGQLNALGLAENTLIVYASDHGDHIGEHGLWWKHTFYDQSAKVPLILSWPGVLPQNQRRDHLVDLLDVTATMLDATGSPPLPNSDGRSFLNVAKDARAPWVNRVFSENCQEAGVFWNSQEPVTQRMVRDGDWKLVYYHNYPCQLFNLRADSDEISDLAADPEHEPVLRALRGSVLAGWDPDAISNYMASRNEDLKMMRAWAKAARPPEVICWEYRTEQNKLNK